MEEEIRLRNKKLLTLTLILLVFGFLWYSQITPISQGPINFLKKSLANLDRAFQEEVQVRGNSPLDNLWIFGKEIDYSQVIEGYKNDPSRTYVNSSRFQLYDDVNTQLFTFGLISTEGAVPLFDVGLSSSLVSFINVLLEFIARLLIFLGIFLPIIKYKEDKKYLIVSFVSFISLILANFLPFFSQSYDLPRLYQQILILISISFSIGFFYSLKLIIRKEKKQLIYFFMIIFLIVFFIVKAGFLYQISGGMNVNSRLNNVGWDYSTQIFHESELKSLEFFSSDYSSNSPIYMDNFARLRFIYSGMLSYADVNVRTDPYPPYISRNSYVYSSYSNNLEGLSVVKFNRVPLAFGFPNNFLNQNKNKIYSNGESEIFR